MISIKIIGLTAYF